MTVASEPSAYPRFAEVTQDMPAPRIEPDRSEQAACEIADGHALAVTAGHTFVPQNCLNH